MRLAGSEIQRRSEQIGGGVRVVLQMTQHPRCALSMWQAASASHLLGNRRGPLPLNNLLNRQSARPLWTSKMDGLSTLGSVQHIALTAKPAAHPVSISVEAEIAVGGIHGALQSAMLGFGLLAMQEQDTVSAKQASM